MTENKSVGCDTYHHDIEWCQQYTAHQLSIIGNKLMTPLHKALYKTLMEQQPGAQHAH
jgi:hypothetical protein